ncbi:MAG: PEGA domain-containing protein [Acidobacteria bacterium]|nr:PEGA domain-containing protein [Acidobacteriota bacterium]
MTLRKILRETILVFALVLVGGVALHASNEILSEVKFVGFGKVAKTSGVWIDGQYVGYLSELNGSKKVLLMPGDHEVVIRQAGYKEFTRRITVNPAEKYVLPVSMERDPKIQYPYQTASIKLSVRPNRAAVFVDGLYAGHVDEFDGPGQAMLVAPGKHQIEISLPGFKPFRTEVSLLPYQKFEIKTALFYGSIQEAGGRLVENSGAQME